MRVSTLDERFAELLADPSADRYLGLRDQLIESPEYAPYDPLWNRLWEAFNKGDFSRVLELVPLLDRGGLLAPRLHFVWGAAVMELADEAFRNGDVPDLPSEGSRQGDSQGHCDSPGNCDSHGHCDSPGNWADPMAVAEQIEWSQSCSHACLKALLALADGTSEDPYLVTYPTDARDILRALRVEAVHQYTVNDSEGIRDVFVTESAGEIWFDVQGLVDAADRRIPKSRFRVSGFHRDRHPSWLRLFA